MARKIYPSRVVEKFYIKPLIDGDANFAFGSGESFESAGFKEGTAEELENDDIFGDFEASEEPDLL